MSQYRSSTQEPNTVPIVARFECGNLLRNRAFIVSSILMALILIITVSYPNISRLLKGQGSTERPIIALINETDHQLNLNIIQTAMPDYQIEIKDPMDMNARATLLENRRIQGIFSIDESYAYTWMTKRIQLNARPEKTLGDLISKQIKARDLSQLGLKADDLKRILADPQIRVLEAAADEGKSQSQTLPYTYSLIILLYMAILSYGQLTATSVASEKGTRTMEILITSTRSKNLIHGKVLGTAMAGFIQMGFFGLVYYIASLVNSWFSVEESAADSFLATALKMPLPTFVMALVIFILTYLSFAYLYAALGSMVSRTEDVSQVVGPITSLYILVFGAAIFASFNPDQIWVMILSFIPLAGSLIYFVRYSMLSLSIPELVIPLIIHTLTVALSAIISIRLYQHGVLSYKNGVQWKDIRQFWKKDPNAAR